MSGGYPPGTTQADLDRYFGDEEDDSCPETDCENGGHCPHRSCCICGAIRR